jgi:hypothetical protein
VLRRLHVRGSRVTFSLSRAATVRFMVKRRGAHRAANTWFVHARSGANAYSLNGRLRGLRRGSYALAVGVAASASTARFSVR